MRYSREDALNHRGQTDTPKPKTESTKLANELTTTKVIIAARTTMCLIMANIVGQLYHWQLHTIRRTSEIVDHIQGIPFVSTSSLRAENPGKKLRNKSTRTTPTLARKNHAAPQRNFGNTRGTPSGAPRFFTNTGD